MNENKDQFSEVGADSPIVSELAKEYSRSWTSELYNSRSISDDETLLCQWPGQSPNGKKEADYMGDKEPFPWEGANDGIVRLADQTGRDLRDIFELSRSRAKFGTRPTEFNDIAESGLVENYMKWLIEGPLAQTIHDELQFSDSYLTTHGFSIGHVYWDRKVAIEPRTITKDVIQQMMLEMGIDPSRVPVEQFVQENEEYIQLKLGGVLTDTSKKQLKELTRDIIEKGQGQVYVQVLTCDYPSFRALRPFSDVVFPPETQDLQRARVIFRRERYSVVELEQIGKSLEWSEDFIEKAKATAGSKTLHGYQDDTSPILHNRDIHESDENMVEIVYAYSRRSDKQGRVGIWETTFCPLAEGTDDENSTSYGSHTLLEHVGDSYPFFAFRLESLRRNLAETRGVSEICRVWQREIKVYFDAIADYTTVAAVPPIQKPLRMTDFLDIRPAGQIPTPREGIRWMEPPSAMGVDVSLKVAGELEKRNARYWGLEHPEIPQDVTLRSQQATVSRYLKQLSVVYKMLWQLVQRFGSDEQFQRVTGTSAKIPRGGFSYDFTLSVDVREMNPTFLDQKLKTIAQLIAPLDRLNTLDWGKIVQSMMAGVDPTYLEGLQVDEQQASIKLYEEVLAQVISISEGNEPILKDEGPAGGPKAQILAKIIENNPLYAERMSTDQRFAEGIQRYAKTLQHGYQQDVVNSQTGRIGAQPSEMQEDLGI